MWEIVRLQNEPDESVQQLFLFLFPLRISSPHLVHLSLCMNSRGDYLWCRFHFSMSLIYIFLDFFGERICANGFCSSRSFQLRFLLILSKNSLADDSIVGTE